eukprot:TRINITY_DN2985_c0_g1_i1.p1 TRINITY_DN2985_c0_g1~~TRINITY_DN2985_c0_g1_i1.p1  ORF type:complete len:521 (-),score=170.48 TRINITY_DN2985_c0_g1_i1:171-1733(-)
MNSHSFRSAQFPSTPELSASSFSDYPPPPGDFHRFNEFLPGDSFGLAGVTAPFTPEGGFMGLHISDSRVPSVQPKWPTDTRIRFELQNLPDAWQVGDSYLRCSSRGNDGRDLCIAMMNADVSLPELAERGFVVSVALERTESNRADCYLDRRYEADSPDDARYKEASKEKNFFRMLRSEAIRHGRVTDYEERPWEEVPDVLDDSLRDRVLAERRLRLSIRFKTAVSSIAKKGGEQKPTCTEFRLRFDITSAAGSLVQLTTPPFIVVPHRKYIPFAPRMRRMKQDDAGSSSGEKAAPTPGRSPPPPYSPSSLTPDSSAGSSPALPDTGGPRKRLAAGPAPAPSDGGEWLVDFTDGTAPIRVSLPAEATLRDVRRAMEACGYSTNFVRFKPVLSSEPAQVSLEHLISVSKLFQGSRTVSCDVNFLYLWEGRQEVSVEEVYDNLANCFGPQVHREDSIAQLRAFCAQVGGLANASSSHRVKFSKEKFQLFIKFFGADLAKCLYRVCTLHWSHTRHAFDALRQP